MWKCDQCGEVFNEPKDRKCPFCESEDIEAVENLYECECCGRRMYGSEHKVCRSCRLKLMGLADSMVLDALLITHRDVPATREFLKKYFKENWNELW